MVICNLRPSNSGARFFTGDVKVGPFLLEYTCYLYLFGKVIVTIEYSAVQGMAHEDVAALHHPLKDHDPRLLQAIFDYALVALETPLHVALLQGNAVTASDILDRNPALSHEPNRSGSYPLHVASARGYEQIVQKLLEIDPSLCLLRDKEGRTPLHLAALNGKTPVLELLHLAHTKQKWFHESLARDVTDGAEPILHFCIKRNQLDAAKFLITKDKELMKTKKDNEHMKTKKDKELMKTKKDNEHMKTKKDKELMKTKDRNGNTVMHLAAAREDSKMLEFLLNEVETEDLNVKNDNGFTALDISTRNPSHNPEINTMIKNKGGKESKNFLWRHFIGNSWDSWYARDPVWTNEMHNTLMLVATLIVTVTFQAAINPPGGVWQERNEPPNSTSPAPSPMPSSPAASNSTNNQAFGLFMHASSTGEPTLYEPGTAIHNDVNLGGFKVFMYFDMIAFAASLSIILSLVSGFPLRRRFTTWVLVFTMWAALSSMAMAFVFGTEIIIVCEKVLKKIPYILYSWLGAMVLVLLFHCFVLVLRLRGKIKNWVCTAAKDKETIEDDKIHQKEDGGGAMMA